MEQKWYCKTTQCKANSFCSFSCYIFTRYLLLILNTLNYKDCGILRTVTLPSPHACTFHLWAISLLTNLKNFCGFTGWIRHSKSLVASFKLSCMYGRSLLTSEGWVGRGSLRSVPCTSPKDVSWRKAKVLYVIFMQVQIKRHYSMTKFEFSIRTLIFFWSCYYQHRRYRHHVHHL